MAIRSEGSIPMTWQCDALLPYYWQVRDPNDPSIITDPNYIGHPDYADPQTLAHWEQLWFSGGLKYDLNEDLKIDLIDLAIFCDELWLWQACWRQQEEQIEMMMQPLSVELREEPVTTEPDYANMSISELVPLVTAIRDIMDLLNQSIAEDHENAENLIEARGFLKSVLSDIAEARQ